MRRPPKTSWHCLEVGGGNGSMTQCLCDKVGASGNVTSVDINPKLIELIAAENLTVRQADMRTAALPSGAFDLVMCRAMLHQIAEQAQAVLEEDGRGAETRGLAL